MSNSEAAGRNQPDADEPSHNALAAHDNSASDHDSASHNSAAEHTPVHRDP
jgi:hypothetical protein